MMFHISKEQLDAFAAQFWNYVKDAKVFAFHGQMGAGKTTIIEALCKAKGVKQVMGSPTFSIINEYVYIEKGEEKSIYHIDLYRLKDEQEIIQAGVEDCIYSSQICFVEWPGKAPHLFDETTVQVTIETVNETERNVKINLP
ncbi:MAG: tRNA (adenosine(37)-N6)-threonylcarbamoyltransferase complex ATPase subunit type 1 TsaE [Flavisolibacter sp.]|jgi:tRNA threonylcarbamoyladenosine biosynthesis protein TsaE